jgi:hypothetical protein
MAEKLPAIHLYPGDWLRDGISGCSLAAQGLWLRMMFVAHDAPKYGHIFATDLLESKASIARRCGATVDEFDALFAELSAAGVPSVEDGFVVSRRMVRDGKLREIRAKAGRKGGKQKAKQTSSKLPSKGQANIKQNTEIEIEIEDTSESVIKEKKEDAFEVFWKAFPGGRKTAKGKARDAFTRALRKTDAATLIAAAAEYADSPVGRGDYVKMPESWLNGECWTDDRTAWKNRGSANGKHQSPANAGRGGDDRARGL